MTETQATGRNLSSRQRDIVIARIRARGAPNACPSCGNGKWVIAPGLTHLPMSGSVHQIGFGGPAVPAAVLICATCGYIALYSLGTLGLLADAEFDAAADSP